MKNCKKTKKNLLKGGDGWKKKATPTNTPQPTKSPRWTMPTPKKSPSNTKRKRYVEQLRMPQFQSELPERTIPKTRKHTTNEKSTKFRELLQSIENKSHTLSEAEIRHGISNKVTAEQLAKFMKSQPGLDMLKRDAYFATLSHPEKERFIRAQGQVRTVSIPSKVGQYPNSVDVTNSYTPNLPYSHRHPLEKEKGWINHPSK